MSGSRETLKARWDTDDGRRRVMGILAAARTGADWGPVLKGFPHADEAANGRDLRGAYLREAMLDGADLGKAYLEQADLSKANLSGANLGWSDLRAANLTDADLSGANLSLANLSESDLTRADLSEADLSNVLLIRADLTGADLSRAHLSWANLAGAYLRRVKLDGSDLSDAACLATTFAETDLSQAGGLETVRHYGPSTVGVGTLYKSKGRIAEAFLRGCGVPDRLIEQLPILVGTEEPPPFYTCFVSYRDKDEDFARRLHVRMRDAQLRVWLAPGHVKDERAPDDQMDQAIQMRDKVVLILSEHSMPSDWIVAELCSTLEAERRNGRRRLFPIRLVDESAVADWTCVHPDSGENLADEVRRHAIPDFSNWQDPEAFETAFARLLSDLKADDLADGP